MKMIKFRFLLLLGVLNILGCNDANVENDNVLKNQSTPPNQFIQVLGIAQDAGYPQIGCEKVCCKSYYGGKTSKKMISALGLVDIQDHKKWLFEATPDIKEQLKMLNTIYSSNEGIIDGIFLSHAHIGHYTGLMQLGREALGGNHIPVYAMPRMKAFLESNGPWSQLVTLKNIKLEALKNDSLVILNSNLKVTPLLVPHRDEFSETVGYKIEGNNKVALFIPDIDKWERWEKRIVDEVKSVDYAFIDATFFSDGELDRDMSEIPHPFIVETTTLFENQSLETKQKIHFIHLNHTNPALQETHRLKDSIESLGFQFAKQGAIYKL